MSTRLTAYGEQHMVMGAIVTPNRNFLAKHSWQMLAGVKDPGLLEVFPEGNLIVPAIITHEIGHALQTLYARVWTHNMTQ